MIFVYESEIGQKILQCKTVAYKPLVLSCSVPESYILSDASFFAPGRRRGLKYEPVLSELPLQPSILCLMDYIWEKQGTQAYISDLVESFL